MSRSAHFLARHLASGPVAVGQVLVSPDFAIIHASDAEAEGLDLHTDPHAAIEIAKYDEQGRYRPLKAAPDLRRGWQLALATIDDAVLALDFLYPAALGNLIALEEGRLVPVSLRDTLARQTGMYAVVRKLTDEQACEIIADTCNLDHGCRRRILWALDAETPGPRTETAADLASAFPPGHWPILCAEACNLFVAAGRKTVKAAQPKP